MINPAHFQKPPVLHALVDFDPDGLGILSQYKYGTISKRPTPSRVHCPRCNGSVSQAVTLQARNCQERCTACPCPAEIEERRCQCFSGSTLANIKRSTVAKRIAKLCSCSTTKPRSRLWTIGWEDYRSGLTRVSDHEPSRVCYSCHSLRL
ncbi:hypothetical protein MRB53_041369 [Persea americana]|nr:hypothetical protein MRB53_041369 [Persea americana]